MRVLEGKLSRIACEIKNEAKHFLLTLWISLSLHLLLSVNIIQVCVYVSVNPSATAFYDCKVKIKTSTFEEALTLLRENEQMNEQLEWMWTDYWHYTSV